jgi:hypothetical protein
MKQDRDGRVRWSAIVRCQARVLFCLCNATAWLIQAPLKQKRSIRLLLHPVRGIKLEMKFLRRKQEAAAQNKRCKENRVAVSSYNPAIGGQPER